jgi:hypothetical protein
VRGQNHRELEEHGVVHQFEESECDGVTEDIREHEGLKEADGRRLSRAGPVSLGLGGVGHNADATRRNNTSRITGINKLQWRVNRWVLDVPGIFRGVGDSREIHRCPHSVENSWDQKAETPVIA